MKTNTNTHKHQLAVRFAAPTHFSVSLPGVARRDWVDANLDRFKHRLLQNLLEDKRWLMLESSFRQAADEAASLAWTTPFPLLVLPILLEEKARIARLRALRQEQIQWRSRRLFAKAAHLEPSPM
jgi:hypothetical protein